MKKTFRLFAILLALAMLFSMTACGEDGAASEQREKRAYDNSETALVTEATEATENSSEATEERKAPEEIVGAWKYDVDMEKLLKLMWEMDDGREEQSGMEEIMTELYDGLFMTVVLDLKEDGTYEFAIGADSLKEIAATISERLPAVFPELFAAMTGMTREELEAQLAESGMTMDDVLAQFSDVFSAETIIKSMETETRTGDYSYEEGALIITNADGKQTKIIVEVSGDTLTISQIEGKEDDIPEGILPVVFVRFIPEEIELNPAPEAMLGAWKYTMRLDEILKAGGIPESAEEILQLYEGVSVVMIMELNADNTYRTFTDADSMAAAAEKIKENVDKYYPEEADDYDAVDMLHSFKSEFNDVYTYQDGKLVFYLGRYSSMTWSVELSGDELRVTDVEGEIDSTPKELFPIVLTR